MTSQAATTYSWEVDKETYGPQPEDRVLLHWLYVRNVSTDWRIRKVGTDRWEICSDDSEEYAQGDCWQAVRQECIAAFESSNVALVASRELAAAKESASVQMEGNFWKAKQVYCSETVTRIAQTKAQALELLHEALDELHAKNYS